MFVMGCGAAARTIGFAGAACGAGLSFARDADEIKQDEINEKDETTISVRRKGAITSPKIRVMQCRPSTATARRYFNIFRVTSRKIAAVLKTTGVT